ncbi:MAG: hypothetical protein JO033_21010 [Acidobacteriaceae bacterium]|nr:hypothetical protein [Acidobacteriaceae bacterium]MBV9502698.1 hypothetical protein [Acidobacteriaceae bacterium]
MKIAVTLLSLLGRWYFLRTTSQVQPIAPKDFAVIALGESPFDGGRGGPRERQRVDLVSLAKVSGCRKVSTATALFPDYFVCGPQSGSCPRLFACPAITNPHPFVRGLEHGKPINESRRFHSGQC